MDCSNSLFKLTHKRKKKKFGGMEQYYLEKINKYY